MSPLFDYQCPACGYTVEKIHPYDQTVDITCPKCGTRLERQMGNVVLVNGVTFRWYNQGKRDVDVFYPDGHKTHKKYNDLYADGGL